MISVLRPIRLHRVHYLSTGPSYGTPSDVVEGASRVMPLHIIPYPLRTKGTLDKTTRLQGGSG